MNDITKILIGIFIFLTLLSFPLWFTASQGKLGSKAKPVPPKGETHCVESKEYMKAWHMDLLNEWRDAVVRDGQRVYISKDKDPTRKVKKYDMSLTNTCMKCHENKTKFCDECHVYVGVDPYCWDCHNYKGSK